MCNLIVLAISLFFIRIKLFSAIRTPVPKCDQPINIYENIGCLAKYSDGGKDGKKLCPDCFDCSRIDPNINQCYYRGKYYAIGEPIDEDADVPPCYTGCFCNEDLTISCAVLDCWWPEIPDDCYYTYGQNRCCPTGSKCRDNNTLICHTDDGDTYEGNSFINPKDTCSICECTPFVTGKPGDPYCKKSVCEVEIFASNYILAYCAPVYSALTDCCPFDYICPRDDDVFLSSCGSNPDADEIGLVACDADEACKQCRYGKQCYELGTRFTRKERIPWTEEELYSYTNCECDIPPYFTCIRVS